MVQIVENQYFGCINYYIALFKNSNCEILVYESYQKMSFRNRCTIVGANGLIDLTIPIMGGRNTRQSFEEVKICFSENWQQQHWKAIKTCYAKAPFFEYYGILVENIIFSAPESLFQYNMSVLALCCGLLKIPVPKMSNQSIADILAISLQPFYNRWKPNNFQQEQLVAPYYQLFAERIGFKNNVSILDMLFNEGPNAATIIKAAKLSL